MSINGAKTTDFTVYNLDLESFRIYIIGVQMDLEDTDLASSVTFVVGQTSRLFYEYDSTVLNSSRSHCATREREKNLGIDSGDVSR